jgi:Uma2 family endonuclease
MKILEKITGIEEYLAFERESQTKNEFLFESIIPMAGATFEHNIIGGNLFAMIWFHLKNQHSNCVVFQNDMRTYNPLNQSFMYPDVVVSDGKPMFRADEKMDNLINPLLIIEVLSSSTAVYDKTDKFIAYKSIPSLKEYVLVSTDSPEIEIFRKENEQWELIKLRSLTDKIHFKSINFEVEMNAVFEGK